MKALFVNGGPRKNWSTHKMLESAMKGATDAGAEAELVHLYDFAFKGCVSCFACKMKNSKTNGLCAVKDALTPVLEKALEADVLVIGSPLYLSNPTGMAKSFMERSIYPLLSYNPKIDEETGEMKLGIRAKNVPCAILYTLGNTKENTDKLHYPIILGEYARFMEMVFGECETLCAYNTYQFNDYSKYDVMAVVEERKTKQRDEQFPKDLQSAYELGKRLIEKAR